MTLKSRFVGAGIDAFLGSRSQRNAIQTALRKLRGRPRKLEFFYRADDPYSHLLAQVMPRVAEALTVNVELVVVDRPTEGANPAPDMLAHHAMRDARLVAESRGLAFPARADAPTDRCVRLAHSILLQSRPSGAQLPIAKRVGEAVWSNDEAALSEIRDAHGSVPLAEVDYRLAQNHLRLQRAGHYQPGMLHYDGDWYWSVDRLPHLLERLRAEGLSGRVSLPEGPAPSLGAMIDTASGSPVLKLFISFRSPYSYLSLPQIRSLRDEGLLEVEVRPVLPMVMRGLPVPRSKRLYIAQDAKREADRLGIPFGRVCDPVGKGIELTFAVFHAAAAPRGIALEFCHSVALGVWGEARDMASVADLAFVSKRVGISEADVRTALRDEGWRKREAENRRMLAELGLWGVPSVQIGAYSTWGQDRVSLIRAALAPT
ncbi:MAG: DsbA family protein [Myxococcota bacterium]